MPRTNDSLEARKENRSPRTGLDEVKGLKAWESYKHLSEMDFHLQKWNYPVSRSIGTRYPSSCWQDQPSQIFGGESRRIPTSTRETRIFYGGKSW